MMRILFPLFAAVLALTAAETYQKPPKELLDVLNAPPPPMLFANSTGSHVLLATPRRYPSIQDVAQPFLGLAGQRINPKNNGPRALAFLVDFKLKDLASGREAALALPADAKGLSVSFSPDGKSFALINWTPDTLELWTGDTASGRVKKISRVAISDVVGTPMSWTANSTLLVQTVPVRGQVPAAPSAPAGPIVQEARGQAGPVRTMQDMLRGPHDEALFDYYATSQLAFVDVASGRVTPVGKPGIFAGATISPDSKSLLVTRLTKPFSYLHGWYSFPRDIEVWDRATAKVTSTIAKQPLEENVPIGGVPTGRRSIRWFPNEPATLLWTEALDGGNPKTKAAHRDRLMKFKAPFQGEPAEVLRLEHRMMGWSAIEGSGLALLSDYDRDKRWIRTFLTDIGTPGSAPKLVWSRNQSDRYKDPGQPQMERTASGQLVAKSVKNTILLEGAGATPQGDRPFLDRFNLDTMKAERIHQAGLREYESIVSVVSDDGSKFITRYETPNEPPNYFLRTAGGAKTAITDYKDPAPQLRRIKKQLVKYKRADGVDLSFTLYLPPDYKEGTRLPAVLYAYPTEFNDPSVAGQIGGSTQRFTSLTGFSHLFYVLAGYAVLDQTAFPIVGDPETVNNTYVEQLRMNAKAAIDKAAEMGVVDPNRVGAIGHSYGAFMTANLLAHTDYFKAGVARSGAYNRTLTPFGFQAERRTFWEATDTYMNMSPFRYADKIKEPLLMIHGQADDNAGTFPVQSERMYQAVRGNGGTVRLVMLPHESHGYVARESVEHTLYEMISWFDKYVKNAN